HGEAVRSSSLVANEGPWKRGVVLSFASALLQAAVAVAIVGIAAALLNATAATMRGAVNVIEIVSYSLIVLIGVRLLWVKGRAFVCEAQMLHRPIALSAAATPPELLDCGHHHHGSPRPHAADGHEPAQGHEHHHDHHPAHHHGEACAHHGPCGHDHASAWAHAHAPEPAALAGPGGWKRGLSAVVAVGARPCSGAIILLVFAL